MPRKFIREHAEFENVKDSIGIGAADDLIVKKAKTNEEYVLITKDIRLTLRALTKGIKVWYYDDKEVGHKIQAGSF